MSGGSVGSIQGFVPISPRNLIGCVAPRCLRLVRAGESDPPMGNSGAGAGATRIPKGLDGGATCENPQGILWGRPCDSSHGDIPRAITPMPSLCLTVLGALSPHLRLGDLERQGSQGRSQESAPAPLPGWGLRSEGGKPGPGQKALGNWVCVRGEGGAGPAGTGPLEERRSGRGVGEDTDSDRSETLTKTGRNRDRETRGKRRTEKVGETFDHSFTH